MTKVSGVKTSNPIYIKASGDELSPEEKRAVAKLKKALKEQNAETFEKETDKKTEEKKKPKSATMKKAAWVALASLSGGALAMKAMPIARRTAAKILGSLAEKSVQMAEKLGEKFPKLKFNTQKVLDKIASVKKELIEGNSTKLFDKFKKHLQEILGFEVKTNSPVLAGIKNDVGFLDAAGATTVGFCTTGKMAIQDKKDVTTDDLVNEAGKIILVAG